MARTPHQVSTYLTVTPRFSRYTNSRGEKSVTGISVTKATGSKPRTIPPHAVVVALQLNIPERAFQPLSPSVVIDVTEEQLLSGNDITVEAVAPE